LIRLPRPFDQGVDLCESSIVARVHSRTSKGITAGYQQSI
jgi:hypothetical protein